RRARVIDFHFGAARGVGFVDGKDTGTLSYTLAAPIPKGDMSFQYSGFAPPSHTLAVFLGIDGEYYTNTIRNVAGGVAELGAPMPIDVAAGQNAWNFWANNAHPSSIGYKAIDDYALRQDFAVWKKVFQGNPAAHNGASVWESVAND